MCLFVEKKKVLCLVQNISTKKPHKLFFQPRPTPPIINNYYNVPSPYYSNPSYYSGLESKKMKKLYCVASGKYRKSEKPKLSYLLEKTLVFSIFCSKCKNKDEKIFKEKDSTEILKNLGLIENI